MKDEHRQELLHSSSNARTTSEPPSHAVFGGVELTGLEPVTFALPARRSPN